MSYETETASGGSRTLSAFFDDRNDAARAVDRLREAGIAGQNVHMLEGTDPSGEDNTDERHKGFWESLGDFFFPEEDRYSYAEGLSRGGYLVTAGGLSGAQYDMALDILDDDGTVDMDERESNWRAEGWSGYEPSSYAGRAADAGTSAAITGVATGPRVDDDAERLVDDIPQYDAPVSVRDINQDRPRVRSYSVRDFADDEDGTSKRNTPEIK
ncbi:hypothetical protein [Paracoccus laeviglucosivorans]|uniref:Heat induced stress protein YflT n=1 Tax=Paracoccus laeviglucosivorans TaxID=1197861 RepID=A0A521FRW7_9RHOB|nr:hypothetical protein [Paracoccus laeviglucosivorans]SMO98260.1 hypothetical protein SAMN06265221_1339 [Paracoccus laeviglucosivorans]